MTYRLIPHISEWGRVLFATALLFFSLSPFANAQERSYEYAYIDVYIDVQRDASIEVKEVQTYEFEGEYHLGYRSIPHEKISGLSGIQVFDENDRPLEYSRERLEKTDPSSWGKYTYFYEDGATNIEWYYDLENKVSERRTWKIAYVAHGAASFYPDHDEIYWNLFTDYDVAVYAIRATVRAPGPVDTPQTAFYSLPERPAQVTQLDDSVFQFVANDFPAGAAVTVALGWQKGLLSRSGFWQDWAVINAGYLFALLLLVAATFFGVLHWYFTEIHHKGRGTIIPEYEPPRKLPPAMGQLIATERINKATWPATIVDLAVRGYVRVIKEKKSWNTGISFFDWLFSSEGYRVERLKPYAVAPDIQNYEREFLDLLFESHPEYFSTIEFKKEMMHASTSTAFLSKMKKLEKTLYEETTKDTGAYEVPLTVKAGWPMQAITKGMWWYQGAIWAFMLLIVFADLIPASMFQYAVVIASALLSSIGLFVAIRMNPRLNEQGFLLRDDWRGFKLYLETAEKDRVQKLTPELFEKFLPYAMVFHLEKQWAKAFDSMNLKQPQWYGTTGYAPATSGSFGTGVSSGGFSPSVFSAAFTSSFTSSFSSSGAGGGSGGGGGAGGGGGGGGGGAG